ncbi:acyl-CoA N-acyltransferase [Massarina eburnea CBS 473.64]|uniref:Acyl-CoA N-acyltransferase n=1 Tax=Massarina eburnea CBS 473.64 TaxID=1395130 RepID=A0A6A6SI72_9PLEO|nr:acyl-CoA N-acyltransferase [Massarina eburnea CBS 473.64]
MHIRPITRDDLPAIIAISVEAFGDDELNSWIFPHRKEYPGDFRKFLTTRLRQREAGLGQHGFVAVTEEGDADWKGKCEVVGYAYFVRYGEDEGARKWKVEPWSNKLERKLLEWEAWYDSTFIDRAMDPKRVLGFFKLLDWTQWDTLKSRWHVSILGVSPKYQRRGIGHMLVQQGQKMAAEDGLPLTLESSAAGRRLYFRGGFKNVGEREVYAGYIDLLMVWEPEALRGKWLEEIEGNRAKVRTAEVAPVLHDRTR